MLNINKMFIKYNKTSLSNRKIEYIIWHDTGNKGKNAGVDSHFTYFNNANRNSSADFFIDDKKIGQFTDYHNEYSWAVGDGGGKYGITNKNSISIEICINPESNYDTAVENAIELTKYLMRELNIGIHNVLRHYDASRKNCPSSMSDDNWKKWNWVKYQLSQNIIETREKVKVENLVVYGNSVDKRAAEYLADYLQCPTLDGNTAYDYSNVQNIYCIGGKPTNGWTSYTKKVISGSDRYETLIQVLKFMNKI